MKTEQEIRERMKKISFMLDAANELGIVLNTAKKHELNNERYYLRWVVDEKEEDALDEIVREGEIVEGTVKSDVLNIIKNNGELTCKEIGDMLEKNATSIQVILRELLFRKLIKREGMGFPNSPYRYSIDGN